MSSDVYASSPTSALGGINNFRLVRWDGSKWSNFDTFSQRIWRHEWEWHTQRMDSWCRSSILHLNQ